MQCSNPNGHKTVESPEGDFYCEYCGLIAVVETTQPNNTRMIAVSSDEWADYLTRWNCYPTEPTPTSLLHKHSVTKEPLGLVSYQKPKQYFINPNVKTKEDHPMTTLRRTFS